MRTRRGAALLFVLLLTLVMATMVGAFVGINRQQIALSSDTEARQQAYEACVSGLSFVHSQLEQQRGWATSGFTEGQRLDRPGVEIVYHGDNTANPETNWVEGKVQSPGGVEFKFNARVVNQLDAFASQPSTIGECPARSSRVRIIGEARGVKRRLDVVLRRRPFTDSAMASGHDIEVEKVPGAIGWAIGTRDVANIIRANHNVKCPSALDDLTKFQGSRGQIKAHEDIVLGNRSLSDPSNAQYKLDSEARANGTFNPNTEPAPIPTLSTDDLKLPENKIPIPTGSYKMRDYVYERFIPDVEQAGKYIKLEEVHRGIDKAGEDIAAPEIANTNVIYNLDSPGSEGWRDSRPTLEAFPTLGDGVTVNGVEQNIVVDVTSGNILVPPGVTVDVQGTRTDTLEFTTDNSVIPTLAMGYAADGSRPASVPANSISNPVNALEQMGEVGAAITSGGSIVLGGPVLGLGSVNADGDVTFSAQTGLSASPSVAVAVRAGRDLHLNAPASTDSAFLRCDGPVFDTAMQSHAGWGAYGGFSAFSEPGEHLRAVLDELGQQPVKESSTGQSLTVQSAWDLMARETGEQDEPPNLPGASGPLTLEQYVRLRQFMLTNEEKWLNNPDSELAPLVSKQIGVYNMWALSNGIPLQSYMAMGARVPEMWFRGLVYAGGNVNVNAKNSYFQNGAAFHNEGAVVAQGNINVKGSPDVTSIYNRLFLEDIVQKFGATGLKLDAIFFNLQ